MVEHSKEVLTDTLELQGALSAAAVQLAQSWTPRQIDAPGLSSKVSKVTGLANKTTKSLH
uniref:Uncharacterized protein n=1 Tax=Melanopsichium pennsylvanicum 4 TaxID=1398559 RepID=A0A077R4W7_9BASI|nr:uncharacterized protein BN887_06135 [Melanopsichium pennsylvanicum 4]